MSACRRNLAIDDFHIRLAVQCLRRGGVVAQATEGVWGLACDPFCLPAVARVLNLKGRSAGKGLILIGAQRDSFAPELNALVSGQRQAVEATWPGAVTWVVPSQRFPAWITGIGRRGAPTVAVRVPGHVQARALCAGFGGPLVSTSANPSGRAATDNALQVRRWFQGAIDYLLPGRTAGLDGPSELRTLSGQALR